MHRNEVCTMPFDFRSVFKRHKLRLMRSQLAVMVKSCTKNVQEKLNRIKNIFPLQFSCICVNCVCTELYFPDNFYFHLREYCISTMKIMHTKIANVCANPNPFGARSTNITFFFLAKTYRTRTKSCSNIHTLVLCMHTN